MPLIDQSVTWQKPEARLAEETDPVLRRNLELLIEHMKAEASLDMDRLMATVSEKARYESFTGQPGNMGLLVGKAAVRKFYEDFAASGAYKLQLEIDRLIVERFKIDRRFESREDTRDLVDLVQLSMRDGDAVAHASRAEALALQDHVEDFPFRNVGKLGGFGRKFLKQLLLGVHPESRYDSILLQQICQCHINVLHASDRGTGGCLAQPPKPIFSL